MDYIPQRKKLMRKFIEFLLRNILRIQFPRKLDRKLVRLWSKSQNKKVGQWLESPETKKGFAEPLWQGASTHKPASVKERRPK